MGAYPLPEVKKGAAARSVVRTAALAMRGKCTNGLAFEWMPYEK